MKPEVADSELVPAGYRLFRKDRENQRSEGHGAGGVSRAVLMQWRDGICVIRLSKRASDVKFI